MPPPPTIPLPKRRNHRVKSGLLYAICLAHHSIAVARAWRVNSRILAVRLAAQNERLINLVPLSATASRRNPVEVLLSRRPANRRPRLEPRARYPADGACAAPRVKARETGCMLRLVVDLYDGARHLPVVKLKKAS